MTEAGKRGAGATPQDQAAARGARRFKHALLTSALLAAVAAAFWLIAAQSNHNSRAGSGDSGREKPGAGGAPEGLAGLTFGMRPEEVAEEWPTLRDAEDLGGEVISKPAGASDPGERADPNAAPDAALDLDAEEAVTMPGERYAIDVAFGGGDYPARCELSFAVEGALSKMTCAVDTSAAPEVIEDHILSSLRARYGPSQEERQSGSEADAGADAEGFAETWAWRGESSTLKVRAPPEAARGGGEILLENASRRHEQKREELAEIAAERARVDRARDDRANEAD